MRSFGGSGGIRIWPRNRGRRMKRNEWLWVMTALRLGLWLRDICCRRRVVRVGITWPTQHPRPLLPPSLALRPASARFQLAPPASPSVLLDSPASCSSAATRSAQPPRTSAKAAQALKALKAKAPAASATGLDSRGHCFASVRRLVVGLAAPQHLCPRFGMPFLRLLLVGLARDWRG